MELGKVVQGPVSSTDQRHGEKKVVQLTEACCREVACTSLLSNRVIQLYICLSDTSCLVS